MMQTNQRIKALFLSSAESYSKPAIPPTALAVNGELELSELDSPHRLNRKL
mgnify:CR=1 FL=1